MSKITALYPLCGFLVPLVGWSNLVRSGACPLWKWIFFGVSHGKKMGSANVQSIVLVTKQTWTQPQVWSIADSNCQWWYSMMFHSRTVFNAPLCYTRGPSIKPRNSQSQGDLCSLFSEDGWVQSQLRENKIEENDSKQYFPVDCRLC